MNVFFRNVQHPLPQELDEGAPAQFSTYVGFSADEKAAFMKIASLRSRNYCRKLLKADLDVICLQEAIRRHGTGTSKYR